MNQPMFFPSAMELGAAVPGRRYIPIRSGHRVRLPCQIADKNRCMPLLGSCPVLGCIVFRLLGAHFSSLCKVENHGYSDDNEQCGHGRAPSTHPGSACKPELPISDPTFRYSFASSAVREIPRRSLFTQAGKGCRTMKGRSDIAKTF